MAFLYSPNHFSSEHRKGGAYRSCTKWRSSPVAHETAKMAPMPEPENAPKFSYLVIPTFDVVKFGWRSGPTSFCSSWGVKRMDQRDMSLRDRQVRAETPTCVDRCVGRWSGVCEVRTDGFYPPSESFPRLDLGIRDTHNLLPGHAPARIEHERDHAGDKQLKRRDGDGDVLMLDRRVLFFLRRDQAWHCGERHFGVYCASERDANL